MIATSVAIPTLNEEILLGGPLADLAAQSRRPAEVFVVDAGSGDGTVAVAEAHPFVEVLRVRPPSWRSAETPAGGDVILFVDARLPEDSLRRFLDDFERSGLDVACPLYYPRDSSRTAEIFHDLFNLTTRTFQGVLPSGAGTCIAVRGEVFGEVFGDSAGFDPSFKFDDIELVRRLSGGRRFGIVEEKVYPSDRRYREQDVLNTMALYGLMALIFALGRYEWANGLDYTIGERGA